MKYEFKNLSEKYRKPVIDIINYFMRNPVSNTAGVLNILPVSMVKTSILF